MRWLSALGALVFLYLALIPAGLLYSTLDSACAGESCERSLISTVVFVVLYGASLLAVLGTAGLFAVHAATGSARAQALGPRALAASAATVGTTTFVLFAFAFPLGAAGAFTVAAIAFALLIARRRAEPPAPAAMPARLRELERAHRNGGNGHRRPG